MRFLTNVVVFLVGLGVFWLVFGAVQVPFHRVASLAAAVVWTWVLGALAYSKVAGWRQRASDRRL
jgi:hypothetical protein